MFTLARHILFFLLIKFPHVGSLIYIYVYKLPQEGPYSQGAIANCFVIKECSRSCARDAWEKGATINQTKCEERRALILILPYMALDV